LNIVVTGKKSMKCIQHLSFLDSPSEMRKLLKKLPARTVESWSRIVDKALYECGDDDEEGFYPTFSRFCDFMRKEARIASGPCNVANVTGTKTPSQGSSQASKSKSTTLSTNAEPETKKPKTGCILCSEEHVLGKCPMFLQKTPTERKNLCDGETPLLRLPQARTPLRSL
jgi:hypothetical protein